MVIKNGDEKLSVFVSHDFNAYMTSFQRILNTKLAYKNFEEKIEGDILSTSFSLSCSTSMRLFLFHLHTHSLFNHPTK